MDKLYEQDIQKLILDYLTYKQYVVFKHHSTGSTVREGKAVFFKHGERGIADIVGVAPNGRFVAIEVKRPKEHATPDQIVFLTRVRTNKGIAFVAHSLEEVEFALGQYSKGIVPPIAF